MFCVSCGAAVSDEATFCAGCGHAVAASDAASAAEVKKARRFKNIRTMNIVGAAGMAILWLVLILAMYSRMSPLLFGVFFAIALLVVGAPALSALGLSKHSGTAVYVTALGLNGALIMLWIFSMASAIWQTPFSPATLAQALFAALFYVVPEVVNIVTLRAFRSSAALQGAPA